MKTLIEHAKKIVLTSDDEFKLAFAEAYLSPERYLSPQYGGDIGKVPVPGFEITEKYGLSKELVLRVGKFDFGWVENILVELEHDRAVVGHIAVPKNLVGLGLGKRLAKGLGVLIKREHRVGHILFVEKNANAVYDDFFQNKLHAAPAVYGSNSGWLWKIT